MAFTIDLRLLCPMTVDAEGEGAAPIEDDLRRLVEAIRHQVFQPDEASMKYIADIIEALTDEVACEYEVKEEEDLPHCEPCPHCGCELTPTYGHDKQKVIGFQHPHNMECFVQGSHIGIALLDRWNRRDYLPATGLDGTTTPTPATGQPSHAAPTVAAPAGLFMTVLPDPNGTLYPVFNTQGEGSSVDLKMVNDTILYYKGLSE